MPGEPAVALSQCSRLNGLSKTCEREDTALKVKINGNAGNEDQGNRTGSNGATSPLANGETSDFVLELSWGRPVRVGCGLNNLVNTCYLNSVLQVLTYTPVLVNYMQKYHASSTCRAPPSRLCMLCVLRQHVETVHSGARSSISPTQFIVNLKAVAKHFRPNSQEDAHEYLRLLLERLQQDALVAAGIRSGPGDGRVANKPSNSANNAIAAIFGGTLRSQVACKSCSHVSTVLDPFLDLSLDIRLAQRVEDALARFFAPELLRDANAYRCERCKQKVEATKCFKLHSLPIVLTIHLKRFAAFAFTKLTKPVAYSETLDLATYFDRDRPTSGSAYRLFAVIAHLGSTPQSGHYVAYVRTSIDSPQWYLFDDSHVTAVSRNAAVNNPNAYVLFYARSSNQASSSASSSSSAVNGSPKTNGPLGVNTQLNVANGNINVLTPRSKSTLQNQMPARVNSVTQLNGSLSSAVNHSGGANGSKFSALSSSSSSNGFVPLSASASHSNLSQAVVRDEKGATPAARNKIVFRVSTASRQSNASAPAQSNGNDPMLKSPTHSTTASVNGVSETGSNSKLGTTESRIAASTSTSAASETSDQRSMVSRSSSTSVSMVSTGSTAANNSNNNGSVGITLDRVFDEINKKAVSLSNNFTTKFWQSAGAAIQIFSGNSNREQRTKIEPVAAQVVMRTDRASLVDYDDDGDGDDEEEDTDAQQSRIVAAGPGPDVQTHHHELERGQSSATNETLSNGDKVCCTPKVCSTSETNGELKQSAVSGIVNALVENGCKQQDCNIGQIRKAKSASPGAKAVEQRVKNVFKFGLFSKRNKNQSGAQDTGSASSADAKVVETQRVKEVGVNSAELIVEVRSIAGHSNYRFPSPPPQCASPLEIHADSDESLSISGGDSRDSLKEHVSRNDGNELRDSQQRKRNRQDGLVLDSTARGSKQPRHADGQDSKREKDLDRDRSATVSRSSSKSNASDDRDEHSRHRRRSRSRTRTSRQRSSADRNRDRDHESLRNGHSNCHGYASSVDVKDGAMRPVSSLSVFKAHRHGRKHGNSQADGENVTDELDERNGKSNDHQHYHERKRHHDRDRHYWSSRP